jgi:hypothetical protein
MANVEFLEVVQLEKSTVRTLLEIEKVNNTADANKPISISTQSALDAKQDLLTIASQAEMEAGTETGLRSMSPLRVKQAIASLVDWGNINGTLSTQTDLQDALDAKQDELVLATTGEMEAGTSTALKGMSPANIKSAIDSLQRVPASPSEPGTGTYILAYNPNTDEYYWWDYTYSAATPVTIPNSDTIDVTWWYDFSDDSTFTTGTAGADVVYSNIINKAVDDDTNLSPQSGGLVYIQNAYNGLSVGRSLDVDNNYQRGTIHTGTYGTYRSLSVFAVIKRRENITRGNDIIRYDDSLNANLEYGLGFEYDPVEDSTSLGVYTGKISQSGNITYEFKLTGIPNFTDDPEIGMEFVSAITDQTTNITSLDYNFGAAAGSLETGDAAEVTWDGSTDILLGSGNCTMDFGEIVVFPTALTELRKQRIEGYLAHKWGGADLLPVDHPFKDAPPEGDIPQYVPQP